MISAINAFISTLLLSKSHLDKNADVFPKIANIVRECTS